MDFLKHHKRFSIFLTFNIILSFLFISLSGDYNPRVSQQSSFYNNEPILSDVILEGTDLYALLELRIKNRLIPYNIPIWFAHLNSRPIYQLSELIDSEIPNNFLIHEYSDIYSNTFDFIEGTLQENQEIVIRYRYKITLNKRNYTDISKDIQPYDTSEKLFELFRNKTEEIHNIYDPNLISASDSFVNQIDNPLEKAEKLFNFVSSYLTYKINNDDKGASWAYTHKTGDCSEFSSLLVALLRIQGIPSRRIGGYTLYKGSIPINRLKQNREMVFIRTKTEDNFQRHAWVEYYVNGIGWIQCDPTWNQFNYNFLDRISVTVGSNFNLYGTNWFYTHFSDPLFTFSPEETDYVYKLRVSQSNIDFSGNFGELSNNSIILYSLICICIILAGMLYIFIIKRR